MSSKWDELKPENWKYGPDMLFRAPSFAAYTKYGNVLGLHVFAGLFLGLGAASQSWWALAFAAFLLISAIRGLWNADKFAARQEREKLLKALTSLHEKSYRRGWTDCNDGKPCWPGRSEPE